MKKLIFLLLGIFLLFPFISAQNLSDNLQYYYKLDETTGTIVYDSLFNLNASVSNEKILNTSIQGIINTGADFSDYGYINMGVTEEIHFRNRNSSIT